MAGYMIHIAAGNEILKRNLDLIKPEDFGSYNEGIIMPDYKKNELEKTSTDRSKLWEITHVMDTTKNFDELTPYELGYFVHLICDEYFYKEFKDAGPLYHEYNMTNKALMEKYGVEIPDYIEQDIDYEDGTPKVLTLEALDKFIEKMSNLNLKEEYQKYQIAMKQNKEANEVQNGTIVYLNKDKSLVCNITKDGFTISSNHTNKKNSSTLINNITNITTIKRKRNKATVYLNGKPYATVYKSGEVEYYDQLTSFETRLFSQGENVNTLPFDRMEKQNIKLKTDLHTHFAAALSPEQLIEVGLGKDIRYQKWLLDKLNIDYSNLTPNEKGEYLLEDIIANPENKKALINAMKIDTSEQETFNKMEDVYTARKPLTKNPNMFIPMVRAIAKDCQQNGVKYIELSVSSIISNMEQLKELDKYMPEIEKETGVQVRFLGALYRHSDKEWNNDETDRLQVTAASPYIVGCDVMGHETNSTMEFYDNIKELAKYAMLYDPNFVIRVHAGENPLFKANARQVLLAVEEARYELIQDGHKHVKYPQVRLGHGIYGFDEPAPWDEKERTKNISMQQLCDEIKPIIEFNMSSNLTLNNINSLDIIPIKKYMDRGIQVVLGTDGKGIYSTDLDQEMILAHQAGLTIEDLKTISKTEDNIIKKAQQRFKQHQKCNLEQVEENLANCYTNGNPEYNEEVEKRNKEEYLRLQAELSEKIKNCGAITNLEQIENDIKGKTPIMITGSSQKHWPNISEVNQMNIKVVLNALIHCIDTDKAYLVTGGTNHGVEKEAHILANKFNKEENGNLIVLGTLTEEAMNTETNSIEANTITHAIIPTLNGKPAKRWFDLPDTVLNMIEKQNGTVVAIGGGSIVNDIIQRAHNKGLDLCLMSDVEGASGEKAEALKGNNYSFKDAKELLLKIIDSNKELLKADITPEKLDEILAESFKSIAEENITENKSNTKTLKLISLNPEEYPDLEIQCNEIDDMKAFTKEYIQFLDKKREKPGKAQKTSLVVAREGVVGEEVDTRPRVERDGKLYVIGETKNKVKVEGSMIVVNPDGEEYIVKPEAFAKKYKPTNTPDVYEPISQPINYIVLQHDIVFSASWGEEMYGVKGAALNISNLDDIYAIQNEAFNKTYERILESVEEC